MPMITSKSRQYAIRFKLDTCTLLERDSQKVRGVASVVNRIVESHYKKRLRKMRAKAAKTVEK